MSCSLHFFPLLLFFSSFCLITYTYICILINICRSVLFYTLHTCRCMYMPQFCPPPYPHLHSIHDSERVLILSHTHQALRFARSHSHTFVLISSSFLFFSPLRDPHLDPACYPNLITTLLPFIPIFRSSFLFRFSFLSLYNSPNSGTVSSSRIYLCILTQFSLGIVASNGRPSPVWRFYSCKCGENSAVVWSVTVVFWTFFLFASQRTRNSKNEAVTVHWVIIV